MSTFSGLASKGEKGKSKFQSLDINSYFRSSRVSSDDFPYLFFSNVMVVVAVLRESLRRNSSRRAQFHSNMACKVWGVCPHAEVQ